MKKQYTFILQVLLICLISSASSIAKNTPNKSSLNILEVLALNIECPDSFTESATPSCEFILPDYTSLAVITGAEAEPIVTQSPLPSSLYGLGTITVTLTVNDGISEVSCSFDVQVIDTTSPALTCPVDQFAVTDENCEFIIPDYTPLGSAVDFCSTETISITQVPAPGTVVSQDTMIFLQGTDSNGNTGACVFNVILSDIIPPSISCPQDRDEEATLDCMFIIPDYTSLANANDNCAAVLVTQLPLVGTQVGVGVTQITLIATDGPNTTTCSFNITVLDTSPPIVSCPEDQLEDFDVNCQFILPDYTSLATITDTCYPGPFTVTQVPAPGTLISSNVSVAISATDNAGNTGSCSFMVLQNDIIPPTITCPSNQIEEVNAANCMFIIPDYTSLATAQDGCNNQVVISQSPIAGTQVGLGTTTITLTASDGSNTTDCTFEIEVQNTTAPNIVCRAPFNLPLDANGMATLLPSQVDGGSNAYCDIASISIDLTDFNCDDIGPHQVTLTIIDTNGNTSSCTTIVTITDPLFACNELPTALCQDIVVSANENCMGEASAQDFNNGSFDPDNTPFTLTVSPQGPYPMGTTSVVLTIDDGEYTDSCNATITVIDTTAPTAVCQNITLALDSSGNAFVTAQDIDAGSFDNCSGSQIAISQTSFDCSTIGENQVVFTITDTSGLSASCVATVTVVNNNVPVAACKNLTVQLDGNGVATILAADLDAGSSLSCFQQANIQLDQYSFDCNDIGVNEIAFTVTETNGLTSNCTALVTVEDTLAPTVVCQDITVTLNQDGWASVGVADINAGSFDACGIATMSIDTDTFDCTMIGVNPVSLSVTDVNGNSSLCQANVTVVDAIYPIAMCQSITLVLDENGLATITASDLDQGSSDNCSNFTRSVSKDTFDCSNIGQNNVQFTVTDLQGNMSSCNAIITIVDTSAPIMDCQDITVSLEDDLQVTLALNELFAGWSDNCAMVTRTADVTSFDCSNIGENIVNLTAIDASGNESSCSVTVIIQEGVFAPVAVCQNVTVPLQQDGTASIQASSLDGGSSGVRCQDGYSVDISAFSCADVGTPILVEFTVYNSTGESDTCYAYVNVIDGLAPEITCPEDQTISSEGGYTLPDFFTTGQALAIDNCSTTLVTDQSPNPGTVLENGTHTITLSATDNGGFETTCEFEIVVNDILTTQDTEILLQDITLYPNPASDQVTITNPDFVGLTSVTIYDLAGRLVKQNKISEVNNAVVMNISELRSAVYMVVITTEYGQLVKQLLKK